MPLGCQQKTKRKKTQQHRNKYDTADNFKSNLIQM